MCITVNRAVGTGPAYPATAGPMFGLTDLKVIQKVSTPFKKNSRQRRELAVTSDSGMLCEPYRKVSIIRGVLGTWLKISRVLRAWLAHYLPDQQKIASYAPGQGGSG